MSIIPTSLEIEKKWDRFSHIFQYYNESTTLPICFLLISNLRLTSPMEKNPPKAILEVACGAGAGTELCLFYKHKDTKLVSCDLSNEMISLAKKRLSIADDKDGDPSRNFKIQQANAESLPFPDGSFDRYFSNFCIHLVADPDQMARESYRVLEKGGIACFSVWGRPPYSNQFTIIKDIAHSMDIQMNQHYRTAFHLGETDKLREIGLKAGFSKVVTGYTYCNSMISCGKDYVEAYFSSPDLSDMGNTMDPNKYNQWKKAVEDHVDDLLANGKFVGLETAYMVCTK
eukprot:gene4692-5860_t